MAEALLGLDFEIHGGGSDLVFPHHENEAAQTHAARGVELARMWVHNGMVRLQEAKMAKSVGNIFLLHEALDAYGRDALIMYFVRRALPPADRVRRRAPGRGHRAACSASAEAARRLHEGPSPAWSAPLSERFFDSLADDFNTPAALAAVFDWVREANRSSDPVGDADLREMLGVLGLDNLLTVERSRAPRTRCASCSTRASAPATPGTTPRPTGSGSEIRALGWDVRDGPDGPELLPAG